jgi:hypothetical protein
MSVDFSGKVFKPGTIGYDDANDVYATSTYGKERHMTPGLIYQPANIEDIKEVLKRVNQSDPFTPVAIRTGGHQYSGASSTGFRGIQLDLKPTFQDPVNDLQLIRKDGKVFIRSSVSWELKEFYDFLLKNGVFLPTGQCVTVCLGGHVQTGGYGMLGRSFGLLGDYIIELEIIDHEGNEVKASRTSNSDLFYGFLGGSPGNLGVLTHFTVEVQDDKKHQGSKGMWLLYRYNKPTWKNLLDIVAQKAEEKDFVRNYDFNINVYSEAIDLLHLFPASEKRLRRELPDDIQHKKEDESGLTLKVPVIVVYAQWVNFGNDVYNPHLFDQLKNAGEGLWEWPIFPIVVRSNEGDPMSKITTNWLFTHDREFPYPYVKRTGSTNSTTLSKDGWSEWFSEQIDKADKTEGLYISSQIQVYGGTNSMFWKNASKDTAYSWRDATVVGTWDIFYDGTKEVAEAWQKETDEGALTYFDKNERRLLWGSYGDWDMKKVWPHYYDEPTYRKLQQIRKNADPRGVFNANPFCVEAAE